MQNQKTRSSQFSLLGMWITISARLSYGFYMHILELHSLDFRFSAIISQPFLELTSTHLFFSEMKMWVVLLFLSCEWSWRVLLEKCFHAHTPTNFILYLQKTTPKQKTTTNKTQNNNHTPPQHTHKRYLSQQYLGSYKSINEHLRGRVIVEILSFSLGSKMETAGSCLTKINPELFANQGSWSSKPAVWDREWRNLFPVFSLNEFIKTGAEYSTQ